jgi:hypothetical protein
MTPQERQLVAELFDRLALLEGEPRDPDAERAIGEGLGRAPNAVYALVQTVLVQDEALKRANARIEELEQALGGEPPREAGFLDTVRNAMFGREGPRGSVPTVRPGDPDHGTRVWGERYAGGPMGAPPVPGQGYGQGYQGQAQGAPGQAPGYGQGGFGGGSFLGTAAASAAGVIGGAMLLNSIRGMFGQQHGGQSAFDSPSGGGRTPWDDSASKSDLARDAGLDDIGGKRSAAYEDDTRSAGLFGGGDENAPDLDDDIAGDFGGDDGGSDTA